MDSDDKAMAERFGLDEVAYREMFARFKSLADARTGKAQRVFDAYCAEHMYIEDGRSIEQVEKEGENSRWSRSVDDAIGQNLDHQTLGDFIKIVIQNEKIALDVAVQVELMEIARSGGLAKAANDPKQADKAQVRKYWDRWQKEPKLYRGKSNFAKDMLDKFPNLESQPVIERWCRDWARETSPC